MPPLYGADPPILTRINGGSDTNFCMNLNISFLSIILPLYYYQRRITTYYLVPIWKIDYE